MVATQTKFSMIANIT